MSQSNNVLIPAAIVVAGAMIAGAVVFTSQNYTPPNLAANAILAGEQVPIEISYDSVDFPMLGEEEAPVTIVEYSDYNCPFCKRFVDETKPQIIQKYIDAGLVKFVRKDFIAVGGQMAAEAAHCAGDQGAYWLYSRELIANQTADRARWTSVETHREYATKLGLNADQLVACLDAGTFTARVNTSTQEAVANGGGGTPFFVINDVPLSGALPFDVFAQVIEAELAKAE